MQITRWIIYSPDKDGFYQKQRGYPYTWNDLSFCKMFYNYSDAILICNSLEEECHPVECKFNYNEKTLKGKNEEAKEYSLKKDFVHNGINLYAGQKFTIKEEYPFHFLIKVRDFSGLMCIKKDGNNEFYEAIKNEMGN